MSTLLAQNLAPLMFLGLVLFLLLGFPVAFSLGACGIAFGLIGIELGLLPPALFQALPLRIFGIIKNETLLAIPFFTFMGLILERSRMAEDLLETIGQLFGPLRGGLGIAVIIVGAMLAATTGVVAASVISMGLISLPIMLRYGYDRRLATGVIAASGTLAQIIPPSLVLIILADQLGRSVGAMYLGAFIPGFTLTALYLLYVIAIALFRRHHVPALPVQARTLREPSGQSGVRSLAALAALAAVFAYASLQWFTHRHPEAATDTRVMISLLAGSASAWLLALINQTLQLGMISQLAQRVTFALIPPLALIFLVLGTIFLGWATPTEGGAMGATGALLMALARRRLSLPLLAQAMDRTMKLSCFVMFILLGATIFNLTFQGIDGGRWVEHLLSDLPGGQIGFLIAVNVLVFVLAFFLDFFELTFIIVPLLVPAAQALNIDLVWLGIILAVNMQTSFMHPPFGFALFYLRSVAPTQAYTDRITGARIAPVTTGQIYSGAVPFLFIQILMVALLIRFPSLVTGQLDPAPVLSTETMRLAPPDDDPFGRPLEADSDPSEDEDPVAAMKRAMQEDRDLGDAPR